MLPLMILGAVGIAVLGVVVLLSRLSLRQSPPADRAELLERVRRLS